MAGRKDVLTSYASISAGDMSQATLTSPTSTNIQYMDDVSVQFNWTGSPVGTFFVDGSIDNVNWAPLDLSPAPVTTMGSPIVIDAALLSFPYIRCRYVKSSGTGTLNAFISAKQV